MTTDPQETQARQPERLESAAVPRWVVLSFVVLTAGLAFALYRGHTANQALHAELVKANQRSDLLAAQLEQTNARIAELRGQLEVTTERLGLTQEELQRARGLAQAIRKDQQASDEKLRAQIGQVQQESASKLNQLSTDVTGAKGDIESTRRDLEATKGRLERTRGDMGEMSGLIARNREELEELKRRGERNIFEFNLSTKKKAPERVGPIQAQLKKVDTRRFRYTLTVFADDKAIEKKDKTVNEPVQFYVARSLYELVVFEVAKDRVAGYLSTPKVTTVRP